MLKVLTAIIVPPHMTASGAAHAAERLSAKLGRHCEVTVASMMNQASHSDSGLTRHETRTRLPTGVPWSWIKPKYRTPFYRSDIPHLLARRQFDIVHLHNPTPALEMQRIAESCRHARIPYVVSTHGFNEIANGHRIYGFGTVKRHAWQSLAYRPVARTVAQAAHVLALSAADIPILLRMGVRSDRISIVPNGTDRAEVHCLGRSSDILRRFGIPALRDHRQITCMFLANHTPNKGLPILLKAFATLDIPFLLIVGGERRSEIDYESFIKQLKPGQQAVVTGRLENEELAPLFARSDLFVFPTLADTLPMVIFEALAHGLPVLASRVGGIPTQIDDECGMLVPPGDPSALASAIKALAADKAKLATMAQRARARAETLKRWDEIAELTFSTYRAVLEHKPHP